MKFSVVLLLLVSAEAVFGHVFSHQEKKRVEHAIKQFLEVDGSIVKFLQIWFHDHHKTYEVFHSLKGVKVEDFPNNEVIKEFTPQISKLMSGLHEAMDGPHAVKRFARILVQTPELDGMEPHDYKNMFRSFTKACREVLGNEKFSRRDRDTMSKIFKRLHDIIDRDEFKFGWEWKWMSREEKHRIREDVDTFADQNPHVSIIKMMQILLTDYPELRIYFPEVRHVPIDDFPANEHLQKAAPGEAKAFLSLFNIIDKPDELEAALKAMVVDPQHRGYHTRQYEYMLKSFVKMLQFYIGDSWTQRDDDAWKKTVNYLVRKINHAIRHAPEWHAPLKHREIRHVHTVLSKINERLNHFMVRFFEILFREYPAFRCAVDDLTDVRTRDFKENQYIREDIGPKLYNYIHDMAKALDDRPKFHAAVRAFMLYDVFDDFDFEDYKQFSDALHMTLHDFFRRHLHKDEMQAWKKFTDGIAAYIEQELKEGL